LTALKKFQPSKSHWLDQYSSRRQAVVILATPRFASWLEDKSDFIPRLLKTITYSDGGANTKILDLDVVCGCIDGLAPACGSISQSIGKPAAEGFSILYGDTARIIPELASNIQTPAVPSTERLATITLQNSHKGQMDITLPLANTLFTNGKHSTLLSSRWRAAAEGFSLAEPQVARSSLTIDLSGPRSDEHLKSLLPAIPLTLARPITSGLGNIVRKIKHYGLRDPQPASKELETNVTKFISDSQFPIKTIKVWALVIPETVIEENFPRLGSHVDQEAFKDIGHWIARGATLCRVCMFLQPLTTGILI